MTTAMIDGAPHTIFMKATCVYLETKSGVTKRLIINAAVGFRLSMAVAIVLSFGGNQFWLTLVTRFTTINADNAERAWPLITIEYCTTLGISGHRPGNELKMQRAAPTNS